ncbi:MAG: antibiotic biosynthesis monooxygenase [Proteobacteria bacterium]|nr:antibiotic biosynthesis monooxygenase [Pseudomonadota bacterium]
MFAVIYRRFILPGRDEEYQQLWHKIAMYFKDHGGALGSCLHKTEKENEWVAYSRWPDSKTREKNWVQKESLPEEIKIAIQKLKDCMDDTKPHEEICMSVIDDLLLK